MIVLYVLLGIVVLVVAVLKVFFAIEGKEKVVTRELGGWELKKLDAESLVIRKPVEIANVGKQAAVIMDALVHPLLPYEQYDGVAVSGRPELDGVPREDDYFEAVIVHRRGEAEDKLKVWVEVRLTARKGMSLKEALAHMVDFPVKLIWMQSGRNPWRYFEKRLTAEAAEVAGLAGVELAKA